MLDYEEDTVSSTKRLTKTQLKKLRRKTLTIVEQENRGYHLQHIRPKTINQAKIFKLFAEGKQLCLHGYPGTGKTFLSMYLALNEIVNSTGIDNQYKRVIIVRSAVPSRDQGFLPGSEKEKMEAYELPYVEMVAELFGKADAYKKLKMEGIIEFTSTSYLRGTTFRDAIVIIDEVQNMNDGEVNTVISRFGENCRLMICGDFRQNDLITKRNELSGIFNLLKIVDRMPSFAKVELDIHDIVRSAFVKEYIIARAELGL